MHPYLKLPRTFGISNVICTMVREPNLKVPSENGMFIAPNRDFCRLKVPSKNGVFIASNRDFRRRPASGVRSSNEQLSASICAQILPYDMLFMHLFISRVPRSISPVPSIPNDRVHQLMPTPMLHHQSGAVLPLGSPGLFGGSMCPDKTWPCRATATRLLFVCVCADKVLRAILYPYMWAYICRRVLLRRCCTIGI